MIEGRKLIGGIVSTSDSASKFEPQRTKYI
jgi:hypothetical protein